MGAGPADGTGPLLFAPADGGLKGRARPSRCTGDPAASPRLAEYTMKRLRTAVIGVGHLGKEHARILSQMSDVELVGVVDVHAEQAQAVARRCGTRPYIDYRPLLAQVDAAVVAVP